MEWLHTVFTPEQVYAWETWLGDWGLVVFAGMFVLEMLRLAFLRKLSWDMVGDGITNYLTLLMFGGITYLIAIVFYVSLFYWVYLNFALLQLAITPLTVLACVLLCDFAYYWEHRFMHRVGLGWATHTVHHSSPYFNISVAFRFGPLDGFFPLFFHLPLALLGFHPLLIFACEAFVQLYQTALHTEVVKKLPRPIEAVMNTPSHHRVHHGSNPEYIDKNYGGIFIIWDKLFGTFAEERAPVNYGLTRPIESINPFVVFFHGAVRMVQRMGEMEGLGQKLYVLIAPPDWQPRKSQ